MMNNGPFPSPFNPKTPLEYMLGKTSEEAAEVIQAVEKIRAFGLHSRYADGTTNIDKLQAEVVDLMGTLEQLNLELTMHGQAPLNLHNVAGMRQKMIKIHKFSQYSREVGMLAGPLRLPPFSSPYYFTPQDIPPISARGPGQDR